MHTASEFVGLLTEDAAKSTGDTWERRDRGVRQLKMGIRTKRVGQFINENNAWYEQLYDTAPVACTPNNDVFSLNEIFSEKRSGPIRITKHSGFRCGLDNRRL